jgi:hypothetical protein
MLKRQLYIEQIAEIVKLIVDLAHLTQEKGIVEIHRSHHSRIIEEIISETHQETVTKFTRVEIILLSPNINQDLAPTTRGIPIEANPEMIDQIINHINQDMS